MSNQKGEFDAAVNIYKKSCSHFSFDFLALSQLRDPHSIVKLV